jgi:hypothetical protein
MRRSITPLIALLLVLSILIGAGCGSTGQKSGATIAAGAGPEGPSRVDPKDFTANVDNAYFPLKPGTTYRYKGVKDGKPTIDVFAVTHKTRTILGVPCVVIHDRLFQSGKLAEETTDWYTQDRKGNVWYFGEATRELNAKGETTSTEGSWQAGLGGAHPGLFMPRDPRPGQSFRQEYYRGHAEDHFAVLDLGASIRVPQGSYDRVLLTKEWTPLEPGVLDHKYYVRGLGEVAEIAAKGPREVGKLVFVKRP